MCDWRKNYKTHTNDYLGLCKVDNAVNVFIDVRFAVVPPKLENYKYYENILNHTALIYTTQLK